MNLFNYFKNKKEQKNNIPLMKYKINGKLSEETMKMRKISDNLRLEYIQTMIHIHKVSKDKSLEPHERAFILSTFFRSSNITTKTYLMNDLFSDQDFEDFRNSDEYKQILYEFGLLEKREPKEKCSYIG